MISYNVSIPKDKQAFFQELLNLIGAVYEKQSNNFNLSEIHEKTLTKRLSNEKKGFADARKALNELQNKYDL